MRKLKTYELQRRSVEQYQQTPKLPIVVILDNLRSMHNVGAVFRSSDAFLIQKIILCGISPYPPHRQIRKSALGSEESVNWEYWNSALEAVKQYKEEGYGLIGVEQTDQSKSLESFKWEGFSKTAIIFGNEVEGLSESLLEWLDEALDIPMEGTKHSLNVGVTTGIVLWEAYKNLQ